MLISVAMIVKNEEGIIDRCIKDVSLFADEVVIVDTGSTDKTRELAAAHPKVKLFESELFGKDTPLKNFSFSKAKNEAVRRCKGKWVIWWDADDCISPECAAKIREIADDTKEPSLFTFLVDNPPITLHHCRMFMNGLGIYFNENHSCHEFLNSMGIQIQLRLDVVINHRPGKKHVSSGERNLILMEADHIERGMNDTRTLFYLGNAYRERQRFDEAISMYDKYLKVSTWQEERFFARYFKTRCLLGLGKLDVARSEALICVAEDFRFAEPYCLLGDIASHQGDFERAICWYVMATKTPFPDDARLFVERARYTDYPKARISDCHNKLLKVQEEPVRIEEPKEEIQRAIGFFGHFTMPKGKTDIADASAALAAIGLLTGRHAGVTATDDHVATIIANTEWIDATANGNRVSLELPQNLNGRNRVEMFCRAAGYVPPDWTMVLAKAEAFKTEFRRLLDAS